MSVIFESMAFVEHLDHYSFESEYFAPKSHEIESLEELQRTLYGIDMARRRLKIGFDQFETMYVEFSGRFDMNSGG